MPLPSPLRGRRGVALAAAVLVVLLLAALAVLARGNGGHEATPVTGGATPSPPAGSCPPVVALGSRGSGEPRAQDPASNGWTGPVLTAIVERARQLRFPDGGDVGLVALDGVDYTAIAPTNLLQFTLGLDASVQDGVAKGLAALAAAETGCAGRTKAVLLGYSQGAIVARDIAARAPAGTVGGVFLLGDPLQEPDADGVQGAGSGGQGIVRALTGTASDSYYALPITRVSVCHSGDPICDFSLGAATSAAGGQAHASYGSTPGELTVLAEDLADVARKVAGLPAAQGS